MEVTPAGVASIKPRFNVACNSGGATICSVKVCVMRLYVFGKSSNTSTETLMTAATDAALMANNVSPPVIVCPMTTPACVVTSNVAVAMMLT